MRDSAEPARPCPRYAPEVPLPTAAYLPGRTARPPEPEAPHAHRADPVGSPEFARDFRHGVDLFNHGYYWEAHEAWESQWLPLPPGDPTREQLQGLIQASAALLKLLLEAPAPAETIWARGRNRLAAVAAATPDGIALEVVLPDVIAAVDQAVRSGRLPPVPPRIVLA